MRDQDDSLADEVSTPGLTETEVSVRGHLGVTTHFGRHELTALRDSNRVLVELLQLRRRETKPDGADLAAAVARHLKEVRTMITRNEERWSS